MYHFKLISQNNLSVRWPSLLWYAKIFCAFTLTSLTAALCHCVTELVTAGGVAGPADQYPAAAGAHSTRAQLRHVHHGSAHVLSHVLQLPMPGRAAHETE